MQNVETLPAPGTVGYMLFNDHIATAEQQLVAAFSQLKAADVTDLVLDIRYNGGGYLDIASEVAYMIAGPAPPPAHFERLQLQRPATRQPAAALTPRRSTRPRRASRGPAGQALPTLNLRACTC